ncbi:MAG: hypothetical protein JO359_14860 [Candidatus Eremiobacteraeota bacterium]|nr:hypothetical protein [Candidatus Eremiobacteraeota bacterium]
MCSAANGAAQTTAPAGTAHVPHASQLIKIVACNPALNAMQTGGWVGYAPAYVGPYRPYWGYGAWGGSYYQAPVTSTSPELGIDYVNLTHKTMKRIEFGLVANGVLKAEVLDVGTFSPGVEIKKKFSISENVFPIGTGLPRCPPLHITFDDGTKWRNPGLPPKNTQIYVNP